MKIVPIRDLKDTVKIENLCSNSMEPVFITKNGYGKLVIMDIRLFEQFYQDVYIAQALKQGFDEVKNGKYKDGKEVIEELRKKYNL